MNKVPVIWLKKDVLVQIQEDAIKWDDKETGGVLIGYWANENTAVITSIVGPGPNAVHRPTSFVPDQDYHVREIERIYAVSNRTETYLGDWHSHPQAAAYLSGQDKITLRKIARYKPARLPKPLMLILGTAKMEFRIWYCQKNRWIGSIYPECSHILYD